ncbi:MAG: hypothetical protein HY702_02625, partial [Gemmatimonadetes bacterium]|nr:hypothetical protein [Gemmatimonadota bacterium]
MEFPVWFYFTERIDTFVKGKTESNAEIPAVAARSARDLVDGKGNFLCEVLDAVDLARAAPPASVDYVFTDPPYG